MHPVHHENRRVARAKVYDKYSDHAGAFFVDAAGPLHNRSTATVVHRGQVVDCISATGIDITAIEEAGIALAMRNPRATFVLTDSQAAYRNFARGQVGHLAHSILQQAAANRQEGIKFLQANMDHTRDATKLLVEHMTRGGFAFAFVSDPYTCADRIPNVPPSITIFHAPARPRVMLLARAPGFDFFPLYLSQLVVAVSCEGPGQSFILVATYAPPHRPLDPILDELAQCFSRFPSRAFILAGDFNAKHPLWGPAPSDARVVQLVQFACANELRVLNSPDSPPTFDTPYASSWIDVSLASLSLTRAGFAWSVSDSDTLSDHRYLEFSFSGMPGVRKKRLTNFARAQILDSLDRSVWFDRVVGCRFSSCMALELVLAQFYRLYDALHTRNLRAVKPRATSGNAWWTPQLAAERSRVRAMR
ncbi:hypothetical protein HPB49_026232 [Dermacentor silvarum]|nr:hypothetical protein HPB49_026232 [Dermacentor silvarum]